MRRFPGSDDIFDRNMLSSNEVCKRRNWNNRGGNLHLFLTFITIYPARKKKERENKKDDKFFHKNMVSKIARKSI